MTLEGVGERLSLSDRAIKYYEDGDRRLPVNVLIKLCDIYNIDLNDFIKRSQEYLDWW